MAGLDFTWDFAGADSDADWTAWGFTLPDDCFGALDGFAASSRRFGVVSVSDSNSPGGEVGGGAVWVATCGALAGGGDVESEEGVEVVAATAGAVVVATAAAGAGAGSDCTG